MVVRFGLVAFAVLAVLLGVAAAQAQTLDDEYERLFADNCDDLGHDGSANDPDFGPDLDRLCQMPGTGGGTSAGANAAASNAAGVTVATRREERLEDQTDEETDAGLGGGANLFFAADYERLDRHRSTFEDGFQSDVLRGTGGIDFLVSDTLLVGGFFTYANNNGDYRAGGGFDTDSYSPTLFASYLPMPNVFADLAVSYTRHEYDRERRASFTRIDTTELFSGDASSDSSGDQIGATFALGYDHAIGSITIGPRAGLDFNYQEIDGYREKGTSGLELRVSDQYVKSLQTTVGLEATMAISTPIGVLSPRIGGDYVHEFLNEQRDIRASLVQDMNPAPTRFSFENQDPDRDFFHVGAGVVLSLPNGLQPFANFRTLLGHSYFDSYVGTIGVRVEL